MTPDELDAIEEDMRQHGDCWGVGQKEAHDALRGAWAEVERLRAALALQAESVENAGAAIARVRALTEDEWGPLSDDVERCAVCRHKWSKHTEDDFEAGHSHASTALARFVASLRTALDGEAT